MTSADRASVTVVIVAWNTRALVDECLRALYAEIDGSRNVDVIVVDNASHDGTAEHVRAAWPEVRLIANVENVGYTRANNQAIRQSTGEYLFLVNADAFVRPGCLETLCRALDDDPRSAVAAPRLVYGDGSWQRWTAGRAPSLASAVNHYLFLERLDPRRFAGLFLGVDTREPAPVDWVSSACMLVRRRALDEIGLMDERFFVYMDDVDLCQRARDAGWTVWYRPDGECVHLMGRSTRPEPGSISKDALRNFNRYFALRHGRAQEIALRAVQAVGFGLRVFLYQAAALARGDPRLGEKARAHWAYLKLAIGTI